MKDAVATITRRGVFDIQVCAPDEWTDDQVLAFANRDTFSGTENGWLIRRAGDEALNADPERQPCELISGHVHIMLDA